MRQTADLITERGDNLGQVTYRDDGKDGDRIVGDGIYTARIVLNEALQPPAGHAESMLVKVRAVTVDGQQRNNAGGFLYSHPGA